MKTNKNTFFYLAAIIIIVVEIYCAEISYYNYNAFEPFFIYLAILLNFIPSVLFYYKKRIISAILFALIAAYIIPEQISMRLKYLENKSLGVDIVDYIYDYKEKYNKFPENLSTFKFKNKALEEEFIYKKDNENDFVLLFSVGTKSTSHYYRHSRTDSFKRAWNYCDD